MNIRKKKKTLTRHLDRGSIKPYKNFISGN